MTPLRISLLGVAAAGLLLGVVFVLIRNRRLREQYALLWLLTGLVLLVLAAWRGGLNTIAKWLGVETYPPAVIFAACLLFVLAILLHYATVISRLTDRSVVLAQELALLHSRHEELRESVAALTASTGPPPARTGTQIDAA